MKHRSILIAFAAALLCTCTPPAAAAPTLLGNTTLSANTTLTIPATSALTIATDALIHVPDAALPISATSGLLTALDAKASTAALAAKLDSATAASTYAPLASPSLGNATLTGNTTAASISGVTGLTLSAGGAGNRNINLTPTADGEVVLAAPTGYGAGRRLSFGGMPITSGAHITNRGGKTWGWTTGGGPFTALSGNYTGLSEVDATMTFGYNPTSGAPNDDVQLGYGMESRFLNAQGTTSSEWYQYWKSALHGGVYMDRRVIQFNLAHEDADIVGPKFQADVNVSAETFQVQASSNRTATADGGTLSNDKYFRFIASGADNKVETSGSFLASGNITTGGLVLSQASSGNNSFAADVLIAGSSKGLTIGAGTSAPGRLEQSASGQQGLTLYNGGLTQYTRYHTGIDGAAGNYLDFLGSAAAPSSWLIRQSSNNGTTMTQRAQLHSSGRWIFGPSSDNGVNAMQVIGSVNAITGNITATGLTTDGSISINTLSGGTGMLLSGGQVGGNAGIWLGTNASGTPSSSNFAVLGAASYTAVNAASGGSVLLRIANGTQLAITSSNATFSGNVPVVIPATTASTSTITGALQVAGGAGIGGRTSMIALNVGGTNGSTVDLIASASVTLDFPSISASGGTQDLTLTITGASVGDSVALGLPAAPSVGVVFSAWVSASSTVTIRATNATASPLDPASATYRATVLSH